MVSDEFSDLVVSHKIMKSEIDYGIFHIRERDGTKNILKNLQIYILSFYSCFL